MRVLNVRFKNLNSLVGEWAIDLTHPAYTSEGFFAITGPTGAGKSTILDAICLALYGKTPRLDKITQSSNEVMSRQTGECFAEVTFETQADRFCSHWSQHRARKVFTGELQAPRHEISDAATNKILETKQAKVAEKIVAVTGMNYGQFTKSMLLAQGEFAIFLQAKSDDRSPILEQITGTDIYSRISVATHERHAQERTRLELRKAELMGLQLLTPEEESELRSSLELLAAKELILQTKIDENARAISWLNGIADLETRLKQIGEQRAKLVSRTELFVHDAQRLARAERALELAGDHATLTALRSEQIHDTGTRDLLVATTPALEETATLAKTLYSEKDVALHRVKDRYRSDRAVYVKVRELDTQLQNMISSLGSAKATVLKFDTEINDVNVKIVEVTNALDTDRSDLGTVTRYCADNAADANLVENFTAIQGRGDALKSAHEVVRKSAEAVDVAKKRNDVVVSSQQKQQPIVQSLADKVASSTATLARLKSDAASLLGGRELNEWRGTQLDLSKRLVDIDEALQHLRDRGAARIQRDAAKVREKQLTAVIAGLEGDLTRESESADNARRHIALLTTQLELRRRVRDLEAERKRLVDGVPCALCGSTEHPYASGNIPDDMEAESEMTTALLALEQASEKINKLAVQLATSKSELAQAHKDNVDSHAKAEEAEASLIKVGVSLNVLTAPPTVEDYRPKVEIEGLILSGVLLGLKREATNEFGRAEFVIRNVEHINKEIEEARASQEKAKDEHVQAERELQRIVADAEAAGRELARLLEELRDHTAKFESAMILLSEDVKPYGIGELSPDKLDTILLSLTERRTRWQAEQIRANALEKRIGTLEQQLQHHKDNLKRIEDDRAVYQADLADLTQKRDALKLDRVTLFGEKDPDAEERAFDVAIKTSEVELEDARVGLGTATQGIAHAKSRIDDLEGSINARVPTLQTAEARFSERRIAAGFPDDADYLAASLSVEERTELARTADALAKENGTVDTLERECTERLTREQHLQLTDNTHETLTKIGAELASGKNERNQQIGVDTQRLRDNEAQRVNQGQQIAAIEAQKRETERWKMLSDLIGSADGKKYRNFAQGITFEMMVRHANNQLQKMTDRYLLVKSDKQPLELNVIDSYQAGEIRSSKNLSGGESFIVSLALALGLSHMASRNVRVDSLFLDEGFGTLDEDALDIALNTLAGLQQDGKLIGVISHVAALKDRISTQIQISPQSGGRSTISGPGCHRVGKDV